MSLGSFILGIVILIFGVVFMKYHREVANSFGGGIGSYGRYKLAALIICGVGLIIMSGLHILILTAITNIIFPGLNS